MAGAAALAEKVPDPELRPHGFKIEKGGLLNVDQPESRFFYLPNRESRDEEKEKAKAQT